jgi:hypothetical protein
VTDKRGVELCQRNCTAGRLQNRHILVLCSRYKLQAIAPKANVKG